MKIGFFPDFLGDTGYGGLRASGSPMPLHQGGQLGQPG